MWLCNVVILYWCMDELYVEEVDCEFSLVQRKQFSDDLGTLFVEP